MLHIGPAGSTGWAAGSGRTADRQSAVAAACGSLARTAKVRSAVCFNGCARSSTDRASDYGSEGWGFESLRARPGHKPAARPAAGFLAVLGATRTCQPPNSARLIDSAAARLSPSRCPYTSLVMAMLAWPSTSETTCSGVPVQVPFDRRDPSQAQLIDRAVTGGDGSGYTVAGGAGRLVGPRRQHCPGAPLPFDDDVRIAEGDRSRWISPSVVVDGTPVPAPDRCITISQAAQGLFRWQIGQVPKTSSSFDQRHRIV